MRHLFITSLVLATLACGFNLNVPKVQTGPTETVTLAEAAPGGVADVTIALGAGQLELSGGADGLATGTIDYNVAEWKPIITRDGDTLKIEQGSTGDNAGVADDTVVNDWDLQLGNFPMALTITAGAYEGELDLSGIPLQALTIRDGASNTEVAFDTLNPEVMQTFTYETGASNVTLTGLANANAETLTFTGGAGNYTLDFTGTLQRDTTATIKSGLGNLRLRVSAGSNVTINLSGGLTNISTSGTWTVSNSNKTYATTGTGPQLTISLETGLGNVTLESK